eukprot:gene28409-31549_t
MRLYRVYSWFRRDSNSSASVQVHDSGHDRAVSERFFSYAFRGRFVVLLLRDPFLPLKPRHFALVSIVSLCCSSGILILIADSRTQPLSLTPQHYVAIMRVAAANASPCLGRISRPSAVCISSSPRLPRVHVVPNTTSAQNQSRPKCVCLASKSKFKGASSSDGDSIPECFLSFRSKEGLPPDFDTHLKTPIPEFYMPFRSKEGLPPDFDTHLKVDLKKLYPEADCAKMVYKRPDMLVDASWPGVIEGSKLLTEVFPSTSLDKMVECNPFLLISDVDDGIYELKKRMPGISLASFLTNNPDVARAWVNSHCFAATLDSSKL